MDDEASEGEQEDDEVTEYEIPEMSQKPGKSFRLILSDIGCADSFILL